MMSSVSVPIYPIGPDGAKQLSAFWIGARDETRQQMIQRYKNGEFCDLHEGLMAELMKAYGKNKE
jgi:hypothetical protein